MNLADFKKRTAERGKPTSISEPPARGEKPLPLPVITAPCAHLGERVPGQPCGSQLLRCELHGDITTRFVSCSGANRRCATCADYAPADPRPKPGPATTGVREAFVAEFRAEVERAKALPYHEGRFAGAGVVIPAGGWKMLPGVFLTASLLRWEHINSRLPIEVWYLGDEGEFDPMFADVTAGLGVTWRNASAELRRLGITFPDRLHGWALKPVLPLLSSFERIVMLDFDCYPVYDPERLWADPRIESRPAAFFPDNDSNPAGRPLTADQWAAFGLEPVETPGFESGQMLIDKRRSWAAVNVAAWLGGRLSYFDRTREDTGRVGIHGDKEAFSIAWNATGTPYHMAPPIKYHEVAFLQHDPRGEVAFVHRCNDKPRIGFVEWKHTHQVQRGPAASLNFRSATLPHDHMVHRFLGELRELVRPSLPGFRDGTQDEQIWREVRVANVYRLPERMDGWKVIDVGAHAGFFTHECCRRGAGLVVAVEPFPANVAQLRMNLAAWPSGRVDFLEAAVAAPGVAEVAIAEGRPLHTGEPHVGENGVRVPTVALDELIGRCGTVDLLKIDAEGAEYPALLTARKLSSVRRIAGEFHTHVPGRHPRELRAALEAARFAVEMDESLPIGTFHAAR